MISEGLCDTEEWSNTGASQWIRMSWKSSFFLVSYFKKWNLYFRFIACKVKHFQKFFVLILMIRAYS